MFERFNEAFDFEFSTSWKLDVSLFCKRLIFLLELWGYGAYIKVDHEMLDAY
jgi:hypothetical protein